jgi:antitoxin YefM
MVKRTMRTISFDYARYDFEAVIARVLANAEPVVVDTPSGQRIVVMPLDDFEAWQETAYLLRTPANAEHLCKSIDEAEGECVNPHELVE